MTRSPSLLARITSFFSPSPESVRESMIFAGRARLITHLMDEFGEHASNEFGWGNKPAGFDPLLVFEFAPHGARDFWTYCTAGLSLCPAMDAHPPTELFAYSEVQAPGLIDLLYQLSFFPQSEPGLYLRPGDTIRMGGPIPDLGIPFSGIFGLAKILETEALQGFPNRNVREEDLRYCMARPGEDETKIQFLRVLPLKEESVADWANV